jgi:arylformamidase
MKSRWLDISAALETGMTHWPGDPEVSINRLLSLDRGDEYNLSSLSMCLHTGTHVDAPLHALADGVSIDRMPIQAMMGRARVIEIRGRKHITAGRLRAHRIRRGERILFKTANSARCWYAPSAPGAMYLKPGFVEDFVALAPDAAEFLAERRVRTVGIDYLSIGPDGEEGDETHRILLSAAIWIVEGLCLARVRPGSYELICLPLKIPGSDGAPARAILRPIR